MELCNTSGSLVPEGTTTFCAGGFAAGELPSAGATPGCCASGGTLGGGFCGAGCCAQAPPANTPSTAIPKSNPVTATARFITPSGQQAADFDARDPDLDAPSLTPNRRQHRGFRPATAPHLRGAIGAPDPAGSAAPESFAAIALAR